MDVQRIVSGGAYCGTQVAKAIRRGELQRASAYPCTDCAGPATEYDHRDYNEPLVVAPVCRRCNARRGKAIPRRWGDGELLAILKAAAARLTVVPWARAHCIQRLTLQCDRIKRATGISRHALRPDIFGPNEQTEQRDAA